MKRYRVAKNTEYLAKAQAAYEAIEQSKQELDELNKKYPNLVANELDDIRNRVMKAWQQVKIDLQHAEENAYEYIDVNIEAYEEAINLVAQLKQYRENH